MFVKGGKPSIKHFINGSCLQTFGRHGADVIATCTKFDFYGCYR